MRFEQLESRLLRAETFFSSIEEEATNGELPLVIAERNAVWIETIKMFKPETKETKETTEKIELEEVPQDMPEDLPEKKKELLRQFIKEEPEPFICKIELTKPHRNLEIVIWF